MNILFLFNYPMIPYVGGVQRVTDNLARELMSRNHRVYYLCNKRAGQLDYNFPVPQFYLDDTLDYKTYIDNYLSLLNEKKIELVINQEPSKDLVDLIAATPRNIRTITCYHLQPFYTQGDTKRIIKYYNLPGFKAKIYKFFCRIFPSYYRLQNLKAEQDMLYKAIAESDRLCLLSERFIPRLTKYMKRVDVSKIVAVNNPNTFNNYNNHVELKKEKVIICVGRQSNSQKNIPLFIDFWVRFQSRHKDWKAFILGNGVDLQYNQKYAESKHACSLTFTGNVKDVSIYYNKASFLVLPSTYEGWGMILTESMNYGCIPCAFDTYESLHDIIDNDVNGIIEKPYDIRKLIVRIEELVANPVSFKKMQQAAIEKSNCFTVDKIVDKWEVVFNTL